MNDYHNYYVLVNGFISIISPYCWESMTQCIYIIYYIILYNRYYWQINTCWWNNAIRKK